MENWSKIALLLCVYGFFSGMNPSDHFAFKFLTEFKGFSSETVTRLFFGQFTYWEFVLNIFVFLLTDIVRYKPMIILSPVSGLIGLSILRWGSGVASLIVSSFFICLMWSSDVAYYTYIYTKVERSRYQLVTSYTRSAFLFGRFTGAISSQLLIMNGVLNAEELFNLTMTYKAIAFVVALTLPPVRTSVYFYQDKKLDVDIPQIEETREVTDMTSEENQALVKFSWKNAKLLITSHFKSGYSHKTVQIWSLWWALLSVGFAMTYGYNQPLWHYIEPDREAIFNGFAEAGLTLFGALGALLAGLLNQKFIEKSVIPIVILCSATMGICAVLAGITKTVFVAYAMYIALGAGYHFMITITSAIVAKYLVHDNFGLIFGFNSWISLGLTVIFTIITVSGRVFVLNPGQQYVIYGCYFFVMAAAFAVFGVVKLALRSSNKSISIST